MGNCNGKSIFKDRMFPKILYTYLTIFTCLLSLFNPFGTYAQSEFGVRTVVIDAGHGGKDPGAVGKITYEKHITLAVSLKLGKYIEQNMKGVKVIYTRTSDKFIPLDKRSSIANDANADVFISIHVNSLENKRVFGTSSWVMGLHVSDENLKIAQKENDVIKYESNHEAKYEGYDPHSAESLIMFSLMQNEHLDQSLDLASRIQAQFKGTLSRKDRGVNQAGFVVLWKTSMPAVLVETGFISNAKEEKYLASAKGQDYIASAIFRAFKAYTKSLGTSTNTKSPEIKSKTVVREKEILPTVLKEEPVKKNKDLFFSLQILSSAVALPRNNAKIRNLAGVYEIKHKGLYKYYVGKYSTYKRVVARKKQLKTKYKGAFVVAFEKGKKIPVREAIRKSKQ